MARKKKLTPAARSVSFKGRQGQRGEMVPEIKVEIKWKHIVAKYGMGGQEDRAYWQNEDSWIILI